MDGIITMASPSVSSLYGNVGCAIRELILSKFPYNFFKYTTVSSEVAFRNLRRQFGSNTNTEIAKRRKPYLVIQPQYNEPDPDGFLQNVPLTKNEMDIQYGLDARYLFDVLQDSEHQYKLKFKLNRDRIEYEINIRLSTQMQQIDLYKAMMNQITWDRWQYHTAALESVIPKSMIRYMSKLCNMDIDKTPEFTPMLLKHLNSVSAYPITYKMRNASGTDEFYMYYTHNLMVLFQDLNIGGSNRKGMIEDDFEISFKATVEFNLPGLYVLDGSTQKLAELRMGLTVENYDESTSEYIPLYTVTNLFNRYPKKLDGLTLYASFIMHTDVGKDAEDTIDITDIFDHEQRQAVQFQIKNGMLASTLAKIIILKNNEELDPSTWDMNWNTMTLTVRKPDDQASYRVLIYLNMESINEILASVRIDGPYDKSSLRGEAPTVYMPDPEPEPTPEPEPEPDPEPPIEETPPEEVDLPENQDPDTEESEVPEPGDESESEETPSVEEPKPDTEEQEKVIMRFHSSIFDEPDTVIADDTPVSKARFTSSADPNRKATVRFVESTDKATTTSLDVWSRILSTAMLYNFATQIAMDTDNYHVDVEVDPPTEDSES